MKNPNTAQQSNRNLIYRKMLPLWKDILQAKMATSVFIEGGKYMNPNKYALHETGENIGPNISLIEVKKY